MAKKKKRKSNLGDVTDFNVAAIKRKEKTWACNIHDIAGHRRVYCHKAKQREIKGCDEGQTLKLVSFSHPGRYLQEEGLCGVYFCCYKKYPGNPTRCFNGDIPEDEFFQIVSPYLERRK